MLSTLICNCCFGLFAFDSAPAPATGETENVNRRLIRVSSSYRDLNGTRLNLFEESRRPVQFAGAGVGLLTATQEVGRVFSVTRGSWSIGGAASNDLGAHRECMRILATKIDEQGHAFNAAMVVSHGRIADLELVVRRLEEKTTWCGTLKTLFCCGCFEK